MSPKMSAGRSIRLSRKRKHEVDLPCVSGSSLHDITDDFQDTAIVFRLPKKLKAEKSTAPPRPRGRPSKRGTGKNVQSEHILCKEKEGPDLHDNNDDFVDHPDLPCVKTETQTLDTQDAAAEDNNFLLDLEKSICSESEKLCPCCKHIVPCSIFSDHFKQCLQKFKLTKRCSENNSLVVTASKAKEDDDQEETELEREKKDKPQVLPCPVCMKSQRSKVQRSSHMKNCAQTHGLTSEQLLMASRLLEKQVEERSQLGLPLFVQPNDTGQDRGTGKAKESTARSIRAAKADPDLMMALALSRSAAEEQVAKRAAKEEKLLALGLDQIVDEDRKAQPIIFPSPVKESHRATAGHPRGKGRKRRGNFQKTTLAMRSVEERERLISEKVASILSSEDTPIVNWENTSSSGAKGHLSQFKDKDCRLWDAAHRCTDHPLEEFYVPELEPYIKPKKVEVGGLLRSLSQIPGRLNLTSRHAVSDENSDSGSECEETSVVDGYCTQLALAELLGSQDCLEYTCNDICFDADQAMPQEIESATDPNETVEAGSGFWLVHSSDEGKSKDYDETYKKIKSEGGGKTVESIVVERNNESCKESTSVNSDSKVEHQNDSLGDDLIGSIVEDDCKMLDEDMKECDTEKDEINIQGNLSKESWIQIDRDNLISDSPQERDITDTESVDNKYLKNNSKKDYKPGINLAQIEVLSNPHISECQDEDNSDCEVLAVLNKSSECTLNTELENDPVCCTILPSACDSSEDKISSEKSSGLELVQNRDEEEGSISCVKDKASNASVNSDHSNDSFATQILQENKISCDVASVHSDDSISTQIFSEDGNQISCIATCTKSFLEDDTILHSGNKLPASSKDNVSRQTDRDKKEEKSVKSLSLNIAIGGKTSNPCIGFQSDCRNVDLVTLQDSDCSEPPPLQLKQKGKSNLMTFPVGDSDAILQRAEESCGEIFSLQKTLPISDEGLNNETVNHDMETIKLPPSRKITDEMKKGRLNYLRSQLVNQDKCVETKSMEDKFLLDWSALLASEDESDVTVTTSDSSSISIHSLVLIVRCPQLYKEVKENKMQVKWEGISFEGAHTFLAYLYTGTCKIKVKDDPLWMDTFDLALQYKCKDLISYLESLYKASSSPIKAVSLENSPNTSRVMNNNTSSNADICLASKRLRSLQEKRGESGRIVRRQLNLSPICKKTPEVVLKTPERRNSPANIDKENSSTGDNVERIRDTHINRGLQSPDLFEESVLSEDPSPSPPTLVYPNLSPCEESVAAVPSEPRFSSALGPDKNSSGKLDSLGQHSRSSLNVPASDVKVSSEALPLLSPQRTKKMNNEKLLENEQSFERRSAGNISDQTCSLSSIKDTRSSLLLKAADQNEFKDCPEVDEHCMDYPEAENDYMACHKSNEENTDHPKPYGENIIDCPEVGDDIFSNCPEIGDSIFSNCPEVVEGNMIDLTLSSSDSSPDLDLTDEEMEPWTNMKTPNTNKNISQQELDTVDAPDAPVQNLTEDENPDMEQENVNEPYITNVWEDFDDVGCALPYPIDDCPTPAKYPEVTEANVHTDDNILPILRQISQKRKESPFSSTKRNVCGASSSQCEPDFAPLCELPVTEASTRKSSEKIDISSSRTKFRGSALKGGAKSLCEDANTIVSGSFIGNETLVQLTEDLEDSLIWKEFEKEDDEGFKQMSKKSCKSVNFQEAIPNLTTPETNKTSKRKTVTPLPDYKNMSTPNLKEELSKYGVRPLGRRKAVVLLQHVYEETHPLVTDSEAESSFCETPHQRTPLRLTSKFVNMKNKTTVQEKITSKGIKTSAAVDGQNINKKVIGKDVTIAPPITEQMDSDEDEEDWSSQINSSQVSSSSSAGSEFECLEESMLRIGEDDIISPTRQVNLGSQVVQFITSDPELHQKVLLYEPFFVEELQSNLKANGVKCNMKNLLGVLDDQCITFRTHQGQKNRARTRRSKKKSLIQSPKKYKEKL
ncbi:uncharacterized protein LOC121861027 [Homarus americanus]|uniref:uncharacterized protein LOC121861027 n=1 Tax=Homarus americanus TaxID=6706 RepID=UPI001C443B15|nr:uncharacterized protein LOC121861027 [Homarus americanus]